MMKQSGAKCRVLSMTDLLSVEWYGSLREVAHGSEKAFASGSNCRLAPMVLSAAIILLLESSPIFCLLLLLAGSTRIVGLLGIPIAILFAGSSICFSRWGRARVIPGLLTPLTAWVTAAVLMRVGWLGWRRGGIMWRGALYRSEQLRTGRRLRLGRSRDDSASRQH